MDGSRPVVGVLGGMGPAATADFYAKLVAATPADRDQEHRPVLVHGFPQIPDRAASFLFGAPSPEPMLIEHARWLEGNGATLIAIPCNTAHLWHRAVAGAVHVPVLHIADAALQEVEACSRQNECLVVGLLATTATVQGNVYQGRSAARAGMQVHWRTPTSAQQQDLVMPGIAAVKGGRLDEGRALLRRAADLLVAAGANVIVQGCTEVPLVLEGVELGVPAVDSTWAPARAAVDAALKQRGAGCDS